MIKKLIQDTFDLINNSMKLLEKLEKYSSNIQEFSNVFKDKLAGVENLAET